MTNAVFFDLDKTLLQYTDGFDAMFDRALPDAPEGAHERFVEAMFASFDRLSTTPYRDGYEAVVDEFDVDADPETLASRWVEAELAATDVPASTLAAVERVADAHPTGVLTNGQLEMQTAKLERHGVDELVDAVVVSNDPAVACRKPDAGIFEAAESALPADEYVYVGDTYDEDVVGARRAGWDAIHVGTDGPDHDPARVDSVEAAVARLLA